MPDATAPTAPPPGAGGRSRRELAMAVLLCLLGAFAVLVGAGRTWTEVSVAGGALVGPTTVELAGRDLVPGVRALGLSGLAGVVALAATRRLGRVVVGLLLVLAGAGALLAVTGTDLSSVALRSDAAGTAGARAGDVVTTTGWPWVTTAGGVLLALAGLLTLLRGRTWPGLGARYEVPAVGSRPAAAPAPTSERELWEALDRGEDPTAR